MTTLSSLMTDDHRECDQVFARVETLIDKGDWSAAAAAMSDFARALNTHFGAEEQLLFPRFEAATGMHGGPTAMMRAEHAEMREFLDNMSAAIAQQDADEFAGEAETLLIMIQQHNMKEENILYPMCENQLAGQITALTAELDARLHAQQTPGVAA